MKILVTFLFLLGLQVSAHEGRGDISDHSGFFAGFQQHFDFHDGTTHHEVQVTANIMTYIIDGQNNVTVENMSKNALAPKFPAQIINKKHLQIATHQKRCVIPEDFFKNYQILDTKEEVKEYSYSDMGIMSPSLPSPQSSYAELAVNFSQNVRSALSFLREYNHQPIFGKDAELSYNIDCKQAPNASFANQVTIRIIYAELWDRFYKYDQMVLTWKKK